MNWFVAAAITTWLVVLVLIVVAPIEMNRQAQFGESAPRLVAHVIAHHQGVAIAGSPGRYHTAVEVEWPASGSHPAGRKVVYRFEVAPAIGEEVTLVMPTGSPESADVPVSRKQREAWLLRHLGLCVLVAGLGMVFMLASREGAALWLRWLPPTLFSLALCYLGLVGWQTAVDDAHGQRSTMQVDTGRVIAVSACGTRSMGGRSTAPVYCVDVEYEVNGVVQVSHRTGWWQPPEIGQELVIRYAASRPDFIVVDAEQVEETASRIGVAMAIVGFAAALFFVALWFHGARSSRQVESPSEPESSPLGS